MRKLLALALAVAMVMSMSAVSFAVVTDRLDDAAFGKALDYSSDANNVKTEKTYEAADGTVVFLKNMIEYGDTAYFPLIEMGTPISDYKQVEKMRIKTKYEMGAEFVESVSIVKKNVKKVGGTTSSAVMDFGDVAVSADYFEENTAPTVAATWADTSSAPDVSVDVAVSATVYTADAAADAAVQAEIDAIIDAAAADLGQYYGTQLTPAQIADAKAAAAGEVDCDAIATAIGTEINNIADVDSFDITVTASGDAATLDDVIDTYGSESDGDAVAGFTFTLTDEAVAAAIAKAIEDNFDTEAVAAAVAGVITGADVDDDDANVVNFGTIDGDYYYFVAVKTKKADTVADADVIGTFEFNRNKKTENGVITVQEIKDEEQDFAINLFYDGNYIAPDATGVTPFKVTDEVSLKWDDMYVLKFECDDEVTINFGYENEGEFTVDASGQGKLLVNFDTKANEAIADANPGVKMFFVNFNGAKFNRTGTFEYEMENMVAAYKVVDDQLVEISGLELSADTATFSTRTLGNYVFADAELVNPTVAVEAPAVEAPAVTNPSTGAAA